MSRDRTRPIRTGAVVVIVAAVGVMAAWALLAAVLHSDRGIDLTDEGLYLLAADPPSPTAAWVVPFGWHTAWLFALVGHDIADFRTAAALIIVLLGAAAGFATARRVDPDASRPGWTTGVVTAAGGLSALLLFAGLLRTPGYNWVNLAGLLVAATAALAPTWTTPRRGPPRQASFHLGTAGIAAGAVTAVVAKPTSGPGIVAIALVYVVVTGGWRVAAWAGAAVAAWIAALVVAAVAVGLWPRSFMTVFREAARFPALHENLNPRHAVLDLLRLPLTLWEVLAAQPTATRGLLILAVAVTIVRVVRPALGGPLAWVPLACCTIAAIGLSVPLAHLGFDAPKGRFAWPGTATWLWVLVIGAVLHALPRSGAGAWRRRWMPVLLLLALAMLFGFGSGHGLFRQTGLGGVLLVLAAGALAAGSGDSSTRRAAVGLVGTVALIGTTATLVSSAHVPYRIEAVGNLTTTVRVGPHEAELKVDTESAALLEGIGADAAEGGWCPGSRMLGFVWRWSSTLPYHLGATTPEPLMVTIFGYPASVVVAAHNLARLDDRWADAWLLTSDPGTLRPEQAAVVTDALLLMRRLGRSFPDDYVLAASTADLQLWRPADLDPRPCASDPPGT